MTGVGFFDPRVDRHLIADEGEVIVDEVEKHWAALVGPILKLVAIVPVLWTLTVLPRELYWVPLFAALALLLNASWRILQARMDRFVITNMRVFRVHGILSQHIATMPIARILDISVRTPLVGRVVGYGHFVFESAAQDQGLREIRFVGRPDERGLTIQRVIQRSGLRGAGARRGEYPMSPPAPTVPWYADAGRFPDAADEYPTGPTEYAPVRDVPPAVREFPPSSHDPNDTWPGPFS